MKGGGGKNRFPRAFACEKGENTIYCYKYGNGAQTERTGVRKRRREMLRRAEEKDREIYLALAEEFYRSPAVLHPVPSAWLEKTFSEFTRSDVYAECYILSAGGEDCGYALLAKSFSQEAGGPVVWLDEFYVREPFRGHGLGKEFMRFLLEKYGRTARIRLETEPENERARKLYKKLGFTELNYLQMVREKDE